MAPGIDGLPAAERDVDVSGPVAEFLALALAAASSPRLRLGLRAFEWLPFPWRFSRLDPAAAEDFLRQLEGSRFPLHHDLLLMAKLFSTLGYAVAPRGRGSGSASRSAARLADGIAARAGRAARRHRAARRGRGMRRRRSSAPAPAAPSPRRRWPRPGSTCSCSRPATTTTATATPRDRLEAIADALPRRRPDDRRRPAADPGAGGEGRRRHHGDQLRHLLPRPRAGPRGLARALRHRLGRATSTPTTPRPRSSSASPSSTPSGWAATASWRWRARRRSAPAARPIHRNAGSCVQCSSCPFGCEIDAKRGMHVSYLPRAVAAGARLRAGVEAQRVLVEDGRAVGVACSAAPARGGRRRPFTVRARRAVIVAGGALGTPELLLRSGPRRPPGRPQPPHPPRLLGRRPLRGGGARLGRRDAELLRRPVGAAAASCSRRPSRRWPSAAPGCSAPAREHQRAMLDFGHVGSIGVHLSDQLRAAGSASANDGSLRASYKLTDERRRPARLRHRPRRRSPLRRRRHRGLPQHRPRRRAAARRPRRLRGDPLQALGAAPRGLPPDGHGADRRRPARGRLRRRRLGQRHPRPLRRRRLALPDLGRRQPDDDHHRLRQAGRAGHRRRAA